MARPNRLSRPAGTILIRWKKFVYSYQWAIETHCKETSYMISPRFDDNQSSLLKTSSRPIWKIAARLVYNSYVLVVENCVQSFWSCHRIYVSLVEPALTWSFSKSNAMSHYCLLRSLALHAAAAASCRPLRSRARLGLCLIWNRCPKVMVSFYMPSPYTVSADHAFMIFFHCTRTFLPGLFFLHSMLVLWFLTRIFWGAHSKPRYFMVVDIYLQRALVEFWALFALFWVFSFVNEFILMPLLFSTN